MARFEERPYFADQYQSFRDELEEKGFQYLGSGGTRRTFISKNDRVVVKIPRCSTGLMDNYSEMRTWKLYRERATRLGFPVAPCRMIRNGCLMMVAVRTRGVSTPAWRTTDEDSGMSILDGNQSGMYKDRLVVYDFAFDVPERLLWERELGVVSCWQTDWLPFNKFLQVDFEKEKAHAENSSP